MLKSSLSFLAYKVNKEAHGQQDTMEFAMPFADFNNACLGLWGIVGADCYEGIDVSRTCTLFFNCIKPVHMQAVGGFDFFLKWLKCLLWLKSFVRSSGRPRNSSLEHSPVLSTMLENRYKEKLERGDSFLRYRDRCHKPIRVWVQWQESTNNGSAMINVSRTDGSNPGAIPCTRVPVRQIAAVESGCKSGIFGLQRWVCTIEFKDPRIKPLHLGTSEEHTLQEFVQGLRCLTSKQPPSPLPGSQGQAGVLAFDEGEKNLFAQHTELHATPGNGGTREPDTKALVRSLSQSNLGESTYLGPLLLNARK
eukprot:g1991.t1